MPIKPIVLDYHGDLVVCPSLSRAEQSRTDDVGSVDAYDADGRLLRASVAGSWPDLRTCIEQLPEAVTAEGRLRSVLLSFLRACGERTIPGSNVTSHVTQNLAPVGSAIAGRTTRRDGSWHDALRQEREGASDVAPELFLDGPLPTRPTDRTA